MSAVPNDKIGPTTELDTGSEEKHQLPPAEKDDMAFAKSTDDSAAEGSPDYKVRQLSSNDEESGGVGGIHDENAGRSRWSPKRVYAQYKPVFHFAIWAVWTA